MAPLCNDYPKSARSRVSLTERTRSILLPDKMGNGLTGKVILITGASSGIGLALSKLAAKKGAKLALLARRSDLLDVTAQEILRMGTKAIPISCDVTKDGELEKAVELVCKHFGHIDWVIANAGFGVVGKMENLTLEDYRRQFETNIFGVIRTVQATLQELIKSKGNLAIMGSVAGYCSLPGYSPYAMSKSAVRALARTLYFELHPRGVSVTHIAPGFIASEIRKVDNKGTWHENAKDPLPDWLVMPSEQAAQQIITAIARRKAEKIITFHGKLFVFLERHFPAAVSVLVRALRLRSRREPADIL